VKATLQLSGQLGIRNGVITYRKWAPQMGCLSRSRSGPNIKAQLT